MPKSHSEDEEETPGFGASVKTSKNGIAKAASSTKEEFTRRILDQANKVKQSFQQLGAVGKHAPRTLATPHAAFQPYAAFGPSSKQIRQLTPAETLERVVVQRRASMLGASFGFGEIAENEQSVHPGSGWGLHPSYRRASDSDSFKTPYAGKEGSSKRRRRSADDAFIDEKQAMTQHFHGSFDVGLKKYEEKEQVMSPKHVVEQQANLEVSSLSLLMKEQQLKAIHMLTQQGLLDDVSTTSKKQETQLAEIRKLSLHDQTRTSGNHQPEPIVLNAPPYEQIVLNNNDVVCTNGLVGTAADSLIGNRRFQVLLDLHHQSYVKAKSAQTRTTVARTIVQAIHHAVPQGRFLTVDQQGIWAIMPPLWSIHYVERSLAARSGARKPKSAMSA